MIIAIDPGKSGAFCLMSKAGEIVRVDPMPTTGGKVCAVGIAALFRDYNLCIDFEVPNVVIEELYTPPTDALPVRALDDFRTLFANVGQYLTSIDGGYTAVEHVEALRAAYKTCTPYADAKLRVDGRKGLLSYAKGAGYLFMPALWGWPITEVKPSVWCRDMKQGVDRSVSTKDQSLIVAQSLWPIDCQPGGRFFTSDRCKKPNDGLIEAALIAEWWRRRAAKGAA